MYASLVRDTAKEQTSYCVGCSAVPHANSRLLGKSEAQKLTVSPLRYPLSLVYRRIPDSWAVPQFDFHESNDQSRCSMSSSNAECYCALCSSNIVCP